MAWTCPYCERKYPDSGIGVPSNADADRMEGCEVCWASPPGTTRFVRPDALDIDGGDTDVWLREHDMDHLRGGQPVFKAGADGRTVVLRREEDADD